MRFPLFFLLYFYFYFYFWRFFSQLPRGFWGRHQRIVNDFHLGNTQKHEPAAEEPMMLANLWGLEGITIVIIGIGSAWVKFRKYFKDSLSFSLVCIKMDFGNLF